MRTFTLLSIVALLSVACQSNRYTDRSYPTSTPTVADDVFVLVPEANRNALADGRAERIRMQDSVSLAERDLVMERQRLEGAEFEARQASEGMTAARRAMEVARDSGEGRRADEIQYAETQINRARARWHQARSQVAFHESRVAQLESDVILAKLRVDLADARVELEKARAVSQLDRPEAREISLRDFEASVSEHETRIAMAEVDAKAWEQKMELRQKAIEASSRIREDGQQGNRQDGRNRN